MTAVAAASGIVCRHVQAQGLVHACTLHWVHGVLLHLLLLLTQHYRQHHHTGTGTIQQATRCTRTRGLLRLSLLCLGLLCLADVFAAEVTQQAAPAAAVALRLLLAMHMRVCVRMWRCNG